MRTSIVPGFIALFFVCDARTLAFAQGTASDYARAAEYDARTRDLVFRAEVGPHFVGEGARFWYRVRTGAANHEYVAVDPDAGTKAPLFDHAALATELAKLAGIEPAPQPDSLPIERVEVESSWERITFRSRGRRYELNRATNALTQLEAASSAIIPRAPSDAPARSRDGNEVSITIVNDHAGPVEIFWLDYDGGRRSYGKLEPGASMPQRTFARHIFVAVDAAGRDIAAFVIRGENEDGDEARVPAEIVAPNPNPPEQRPPRVRSETSPDGAWRTHVEDHDFVLTQVETGAASRFDATAYGAPRFDEAVVWSADSRYGIVRARQQGDGRKVTIVESSPRDQVQPKTHSFDYDKPGDALAAPRLMLLDVATRALRPIDPASVQENAWSIDRIRWAEDGRSVRFLVNQRGHQLLRYVEVDAATGAARTIIEERSDTFLDYSNKTYLEDIGKTGDLLWMSERSGWNHLYRIDAATGAVKHAVTNGEFVVKRVLHLDAVAGHVDFLAVGVRPGEDPYHEHYCRASLDGSKFTRLTEGDGTHEIQFVPDRRYFVDRWSRVDHLPVTELRRTADGSLVFELERADWSALLATGWRAAERFVAKGRDGVTDIHGFVVRPDGYDPKKKYPVVEHIYAGPHDHHVPKEFSRHVFEHELAELGFIVVRIDGMGTNWRSKAFHDVCWRNLKDAGLPDRIAWLRALAAHDPSLDLDRVGVFGGSAGGQNALAALLHHGDFYKVAVADCGCHDNRMDKVWWNEAWMGWPIGPWYAENSNVTHAAKLTGKLLLIVGELDRNVDPASTLQVADALIRADKDFDFLLIPGAGHGAAESPYGRRRRADFLVRHLLGVEPRAR
jgi:dipeptidyl-peptidase 4